MKLIKKWAYIYAHTRIPVNTTMMSGDRHSRSRSHSPERGGEVNNEEKNNAPLPVTPSMLVIRLTLTMGEKVAERKSNCMLGIWTMVSYNV